jgi:hypothetical protein
MNQYKTRFFLQKSERIVVARGPSPIPRDGGPGRDGVWVRAQASNPRSRNVRNNNDNDSSDRIPKKIVRRIIKEGGLAITAGKKREYNP